MAVTVISADGDMLDHIVWRTCGRTAGPLEMVLDANEHLRHVPPVMPAGVTVVIPDAAFALPERPVFKLWE